MHPDDLDQFPFYRPEPAYMFRKMSEIKPAILYIFGEKSHLSSPAARRKKLQMTGTGIGGSGGVTSGLVQEVVLSCGHMVPMERVQETAQASAEFIAARVAEWKSRTETFHQAWERVPYLKRVSVDRQWEENIGASPKKGKL
jgi:hypothetical protein